MVMRLKRYISSINNCEVWPDDWPRHYNSNEPCDMLVGPCCCGAWHQEGDFTYDKDSASATKH